jgi:hypothetical protein
MISVQKTVMLMMQNGRSQSDQWFYSTLDAPEPGGK